MAADFNFIRDSISEPIGWHGELCHRWFCLNASAETLSLLEWLMKRRDKVGTRDDRRAIKHSPTPAILTMQRRATSPSAFCAPPTCRTMRSTVSAAMKPCCGAKLPRPFLHVMPWIDANLRSDDSGCPSKGDVSLLA